MQSIVDASDAGSLAGLPPPSSLAWCMMKRCSACQSRSSSFQRNVRLGQFDQEFLAERMFGPISTKNVCSGQTATKNVYWVTKPKLEKSTQHRLGVLETSRKPQLTRNLFLSSYPRQRSLSLSWIGGEELELFVETRNRYPKQYNSTTRATTRVLQYSLVNTLLHCANHNTCKLPTT